MDYLHEKTSVTEKIQEERIVINVQGEQRIGTLFVKESPELYPALLICHGAGEFKESYNELCRFLAEKGIAAFSFDFYGHGESEGERFHVRIRQWVADIQAALDLLSAHPTIDHQRIGAFGFSSGGTAVLEAGLAEHRLKALVLLDATVRNSMSPVLTIAIGIFNIIGKVKKRLTGSDLRIPLGQWSKDIHAVADSEIELNLDPRYQEAFMDLPFPGAVECFFVDTIKRVHRINIPTLVIWGGEDELDPPETAHLLYKALTCEKELKIIDGNGHLGHIDRHKEQVFEAVFAWASKHLLRE